MEIIWIIHSTISDFSVQIVIHKLPRLVWENEKRKNTYVKVVEKRLQDIVIYVLNVHQQNVN